MHAELFVRRRASTPVLCTAELRDKLVNASGLPCRVESNGAKVEFVFGDSDVLASLDVDEDGNPVTGVVGFSHRTALRNVTSVCRTFRESGWDLGDVP
jgi:hypothetical protein